MIGSFLFRVRAGQPLPPGRAYAFYSCLLSLLPEAYAQALHAQGETPVSTCIYSETGESFWRVQLLDDAAAGGFAPVLKELNALPLNTGAVGLELLEEKSLSAEQLIAAARERESRRYYSLRFLSPTAFRQNGRYTVLPEKELILQSLLTKWNISFPSYPLEDEDALRMLAEGLRVSDYNLRTIRFPLKEMKIPGFVGSLCFDTHLSPPLLELWKMLFTFSEYAGVGIKTALGMGGVALGSAPAQGNQ